MRGISWTIALILAAVASADEPKGPVQTSPSPPTPTGAPAEELSMPVIVIDPAKNDPAQPPTVKPPASGDEARIPGSIRGSEEYLLWWTKSAPLPPLATRAFRAQPILGQPGTRDLFGETLNLGEQSGGRFVLATQISETRSTGLEVGYWFLGSRTTGFSVMGIADIGQPIIGRPFIDAATGQESFATIAAPGFQSGAFNVSQTERSQGVEINVVTNLCEGDRWQLDGIAGYRFVDLHEGLNLTQYGVIEGTLADRRPTQFARADDFDCDNRYNGGQLGLRGDIRRGPLFLELTGKVAFGGVTEVVRVSGETGTTLPGQVQTIKPGGLLALESNSGRVTRSAFAVLPEAIARAGFAWGEHTRFFVGYNLLYLSDAVRPGEQIDRTINVSTVPFVTGIHLPGGPERPILDLHSTSIWLQGILIGFEGMW